MQKATEADHDRLSWPPRYLLENLDTLKRSAIIQLGLSHTICLWHPQTSRWTCVCSSGIRTWEAGGYHEVKQSVQEKMEEALEKVIPADRPALVQPENDQAGRLSCALPTGDETRRCQLTHLYTWRQGSRGRPARYQWNRGKGSEDGEAEW